MVAKSLHQPGWRRRLGFGLAFALAACVAVALLWQAGMDARDTRRFPPPGERLEVSGHGFEIAGLAHVDRRHRAPHRRGEGVADE